MKREYTQNFTSRNRKHWREWLGKFVGQPNVVGVEIGSFEGRSSVWFCENILTGPGARLACYDPFLSDNGTPMVDSATKERFLKNTAGLPVELVERQFDGGATMIGNRPSFVYVDGSHNSWDVLRDMCLAWEVLLPDGVMIMDDYYWAMDPDRMRRPKHGINIWLRAKKSEYEMIHKGWQVCVSKKS